MPGVPDIKLIRTDTTLDLSHQAEKRYRDRRGNSAKISVAAVACGTHAQKLDIQLPPLAEIDSALFLVKEKRSREMMVATKLTTKRGRERTSQNECPQRIHSQLPNAMRTRTQRLFNTTLAVVIILASNVGTTELKRSSSAWKESPTKSLREFPWRNLCLFLKTQDVAKQIGA